MTKSNALNELHALINPLRHSYGSSFDAIEWWAFLAGTACVGQRSLSIGWSSYVIFGMTLCIRKLALQSSPSAICPSICKSYHTHERAM